MYDLMARSNIEKITGPRARVEQLKASIGVTNEAIESIEKSQFFKQELKERKVCLAACF